MGYWCGSSSQSGKNFGVHRERDQNFAGDVLSEIFEMLGWALPACQRVSQERATSRHVSPYFQIITTISGAMESNKSDFIRIHRKKSEVVTIYIYSK